MYEQCWCQLAQVAMLCCVLTASGASIACQQLSWMALHVNLRMRCAVPDTGLSRLQVSRRQYGCTQQPVGWIFLRRPHRLCCQLPTWLVEQPGVLYAPALFHLLACKQCMHTSLSPQQMYINCNMPWSSLLCPVCYKTQATHVCTTPPIYSIAKMVLHTSLTQSPLSMSAMGSFLKR